MSKRGDDYYDGEAEVYSEKRYPRAVQNYIQFLFTHRRAIVLACMQRVIADTTVPRSLFEMGCADGVLLRAIAERYPGAFERMVGSDVSEPMLHAARELTPDTATTYVLREALPESGVHTCAMEVGVGALVLDTEGELAILAKQLIPGGYLVCSIAGRNSLAALWGSTAADRAVLKTYRVYEAAMHKYFTLEAVYSCGTYIPLVWRSPRVGRFLQPVCEVIGRVFSELAHERVYVLKKKV